jgi:hypothetical protein
MLVEIGFRVETASSATRALSVARTRPIDFVLVAEHLLNEAWIDTIRGAAGKSKEYRYGRDGVIPLARVLSTASIASTHPAPRSAAERWAALVLQACRSEGDLKTLADWAAFVGVSYSSLCEACRLVEMRPRDARDLVRVLRAIIKSSKEGVDAAVLLDVRDRRTLRTLLNRAGVAAHEIHVSVDQFLSDQKFVVTNNVGLIALRRFLAISV